MGQDLRAAFLEQFGLAGIMSSPGTPGEVFEALLKSKELTREVLSRNNGFREVGVGARAEERAVDRFRSTVSVAKSRKQPTLSVSVRSSCPVYAFDMANTFVLVLGKYNRENTLTSAKRLRRYIERRLNAARDTWESPFPNKSAAGTEPSTGFGSRIRRWKSIRLTTWNWPATA